MKKIIYIFLALFIGMNGVYAQQTNCSNAVSNTVTYEIKELSRICDDSKEGCWYLDNIDSIGFNWYPLTSADVLYGLPTCGNRSVLQNALRITRVGNYRFKIIYPTGNANNTSCESDPCQLAVPHCATLIKNSGDEIKELSRSFANSVVGQLQRDDALTPGFTWVNVPSSEITGNFLTSGDASVTQVYKKPVQPVGSWNYRYLYTAAYPDGSGCATNYEQIIISGVLPVRLLVFTTSISDAKVIISWQVALDTDADWYYVERSEDGANFRTILMVMPKNQSGTVSYQFADPNATKATTYYYRLKIANKGGSTQYSNIVSAKIPNHGSSGLSIVPNPAVNNIIVRLDGKQLSTNAIVQIVDMYGKALLQCKGTSTINISNLPSAIYCLKVTDENGQVSSMQFVK
jgi:hypothetical protein